MHQIFMDLLFALIYGVVIWAIHTITKKVVPFIELKLSESKYGWAAEIISNAVRAYEQTVSGPGMGEDKFQLVMEFVNRELRKFGIKLSEEQITVLIESAVQAMNAEKLIVDDVIEKESGVVYPDIENVVACEDLSDEDVDRSRPRPREKRVTNNSKGVTVRKE